MPNCKAHAEPINQQTNQMNQNITSVSVFMSAAWISMRLHPEELRIITTLQSDKAHKIVLTVGLLFKFFEINP